MPELDLTSGRFEYEDTGGPGPIVVFMHGLMMDNRVWSDVVARLAPDFRCIAPVFPLGSHRWPMHEDADLSPPGLAALLAEFLDVLDLQEVTLAINDVSYPLTLATANHRRLSRLVITPCEAFDNIPPGLPGKFVGLAARLPGGLWLATQSLRVPGVQRLPITFGRMSTRSIPRTVLDRWLAPARRSRSIRADLLKYIRTATAEWQTEMTRSLTNFSGSTLILWGPQDKVMPFQHAQLLERRLAQATLVPVPGARTLMPLDRPGEVAAHMREFLTHQAAE